MLKSSATLLFWGILNTCITQAQQIYFGKVLDALTREPVPAATVGLEGLANHTYTDSLGRFQLPANASTKSSTLKVHCLAYKPWSGQLSANAAEIIVLLEATENELEAVVVSATMKEISKDASPIPVEIYTPRFFQKNATPTFFEALTVVNGVRPQLNCNVCNTGDIHINGMEGPYTMVTIDGMPIVSGLSTVYGLSGIPNGLVERIEVVKGPASTLYGSEAVGGMVNVITKSALTAPRFFADVFALCVCENTF